MRIISAKTNFGFSQSALLREQEFLAFGFFGALNDYCSNDYTKEETVRMISAMSAGLAEIAQQLHAAGNKVGNGNKNNK